MARTPAAGHRRTTGRVSIREVVRPGDPAVAKAYRVLDRLFDVHELVAVNEWKSSLRESAGELWTDVRWHLFVAERKGRVLGLVTGNYLGNLNTGVVGYLAVVSAGRGMGLGAKLRRRLRDRLDRDAHELVRKPMAALVGEVSEDNPWLGALARRPSVLPLDFTYYQPRLAPAHTQTQFVLYYESVGRIRRTMPAAELRQLLFAIWRRVYRIARPLDRPAFRRMMSALRARRSIGRRQVTVPSSRRSVLQR